MSTATATAVPTGTYSIDPSHSSVEFAVRHMASAEAELRVIPGVWGHFAGGGLNDTDTKFIDDALKELLAS